MSMKGADPLQGERADPCLSCLGKEHFPGRSTEVLEAGVTGARGQERAGMQ